MHAVVVDSLTDSPSTGTLITDANIGRLDMTPPSYAILLPVEERLWRERTGALATHCIDRFGDEGIPLRNHDPRRVATMLLDLDEGCPYLHWVLGVRANGPSPAGSFGLVAAPLAGIVARSVHDHEPLRITPEFTSDPSQLEAIGGRCRVSTAGVSGFAGFQIHAVANDVTILWVAISQCSAPHHMKWMTP
jgi:hypothetical protein